MPQYAPANFATPDPYGAEQISIERQRRLADALQMQSQQPLDVSQSAGGWAIPVSPLSAIAKVLQGGVAGMAQKKGDEREQALAAKYQSDLSQALVNAQQAAGPHPEAVDTSGEGTGSMDMSGTAGPAQQMVPGSREKMIQALMAHPATRPLAMQQYSRDLAMDSVFGPQGGSGTGGGAGMPAAASAQPGAATQGAGTVGGAPDMATIQKALLSGDPSLQKWGEAMLTASRGIAQRPGAPVVNPFTGAVIAQPAPQSVPGVGINMGPQGATAYQVPNAAPAMAGLAGQISGAQAAAKVPYEPVTTAAGATMPAYMAPGFQPPPLPGQPAAAAPTAAPSPAGFPRETPAQLSAAGSRQLEVLGAEAKRFTDAGQPVPAELQGEIANAQKRAAGQYPTTLPGATGIGQTTVGKTRAEAVAKSSDEYVNQVRENASGSVSQNRLLDELQQNLDQVTPGKLAAVKKSIAQWKVATGIASDADKQIAASSETADKLTGQLVSNALRKMSAKPSQLEFQIFLDKFVPGLNLSPQGAQSVIQFMRQVNNLDAQKYDEFQAWKKTQPADTDYRDFDVMWNRKMAASPLAAGQSWGTGNAVKDIVSSGQQAPAGPKIVNWSDLGRKTP